MTTQFWVVIGTPRASLIGLSAFLAVMGSHGLVAQSMPPGQRPSFAGTWVPADPNRSEVLFSSGISSVAGVSGQGRLVVEQRPDRLILTRQLSDDALNMMLNFKGSFDTTTVYRIVVPQSGDGGLGAGGDTRSSWQGDRLVLQILGAPKPTTVTFSLDGERLKLESRVVVGPGKENNTVELFTRLKSSTTSAQQATVSALQERPAPRNPMTRPGAIPRRPHTPLTDLLKPGQKELIVEKHDGQGLTGRGPAGMSQLEWLTSVSPYVFVMRVSDLKPRYVDENSWLETTVTAQADAVLKDSPAYPIDVTRPLEFEHDGGVIVAQGATIRAELGWADQFERGGRYLVFAGWAEQRWVISAGAAYRIGPQEELKSLGRHARDPNKTEDGVALLQAIARIRAVK